MTHCVYELHCKSPALAYFKGRFFCIEHARMIKERLARIIAEIEKRENRSLPRNEKIGINSPRHYVDSSFRTVKLRGQHLTISKQELEELNDYQYVAINRK